MGELVTRSGETIRKGRVSPALRSAIELIVTEGLSIADAAQLTGYKANSLQVALRKPHVRVARAAVKRTWLDSQTEKAWIMMAKLANGAGSEDVRHKSAKVFLDAAGELTPGDGQGAGPRTLVQIVMHHPAASEQPTLRQLPGVIEAQPIQRARRDPSNFATVGRDE